MGSGRNVSGVNRPPLSWPRALVQGAPAPSARALLVSIAVVVLAAGWLTDLDRSLAQQHRGIDALVLFSGAVMSAAAAWTLRPRASYRTLVLAAFLVLATGLATTVVYRLLPPPHDHRMGIAEVLAVGVVVLLVAYRGHPALMAVIAVLAFVALFTGAFRSGGPLDADNALIVGAILVPGLYARWRAELHAARVEDVRRAEREALARDLHDVVAHQVTGIVVQAQALRHIATADPALLRTAFTEIEQAGSDALTAMRRLVGALRDGSAMPGGAVDPGESLGALRRRGTGSGPEVVVHIGIDLAAVPVEIAAAVVRIAGEAVTNAGRHARAARTIAVTVTGDPGTSVVLDVRDDGHGGSVHHGSGYGLIGMAERAHLLGGTFHAGPAASGKGWQVTARLPLSAAVRGSRGR